MTIEHRTAAVSAIGDELTLGQALDTNSKWIAAALTDAGVPVVEHATLDDDLGRIASALERLTTGADLVVATGGLGPTADDLTRHAVARVMGADLIEDAEALALIRGWFESRGRTMPEANRVQAHRPASARFLANANGTAPGLAVRIGRADVFCLPGPPREMKPMFDADVRPALRVPPGRIVRTRVLKSFGLGESAAAERMRQDPEGDLMRRDRAPLVGVTASMGVLTVRLRDESAADEAEAERRLDATEDRVRACLGRYVYARGEVSVAAALVDQLHDRHETVALAESCTGGLIGAALTDVPGSSDVFLGGWVTYSNAMKRQELGVAPGLFKDTGGERAPGAVSAEVAAAMAEGARERSGADHALSVTGIAGPGGAAPGKPVGTVFIGRASPGEETEVRRFEFLGGRESVRVWSVTSALAMLLLAADGPGAERLPLLGERAPS